MRRLLLCLLASGLPIACSSTPPDNGSQAVQSERWATPVKHDANLYRIDDKLYRSEQPVAEDGEAIVKLGIQSVINLRFFDRNDDDYLKAYGLTLLNRPLLSWSIKPKEIAEILYLIEKQQQNGAVLIHCYHGADRTGLIAGMYRIIYQGWTVEEAKAEMQHGPYGYHSIWKNIANLFTEEKVKQVKTHLEASRKRG
ncbi:putative TIGR01244 family protein [Neisseria flavescens SK114]|nr:putative TIGR01244 family protein [Neisseria flavescens SK114]